MGAKAPGDSAKLPEMRWRARRGKAGAATANTVKLPCFSMSQPFAALLCNGIKTIESRNHNMLEAVPPNSSVLLHINNKIYPDGGDHVHILRESGITDVKGASTIRVGGSGEICAILKIGETSLLSLEERSTEARERGVVARAENAGKYQTEILGVSYLQAGVKMAGKGGVYEVAIERSVLPAGWELT